MWHNENKNGENILRGCVREGWQAFVKMNEKIYFFNSKWRTCIRMDIWWMARTRQFQSTNASLFLTVTVSLLYENKNLYKNWIKQRRLTYLRAQCACCSINVSEWDINQKNIRRLHIELTRSTFCLKPKLRDVHMVVYDNLKCLVYISIIWLNYGRIK